MIESGKIGWFNQKNGRGMIYGDMGGGIRFTLKLRRLLERGKTTWPRFTKRFRKPRRVPKQGDRVVYEKNRAFVATGWTYGSEYRKAGGNPRDP